MLFRMSWHRYIQTLSSYKARTHLWKISIAGCCQALTNCSKSCIKYLHKSVQFLLSKCKKNTFTFKHRWKIRWKTYWLSACVMPMNASLHANYINTSKCPLTSVHACTSVSTIIIFQHKNIYLHILRVREHPNLSVSTSAYLNIQRTHIYAHMHVHTRPNARACACTYTHTYTLTQINVRTHT